jgi:hypothetical protein
MIHKKPSRSLNMAKVNKPVIPVQALALQGGEIALGYALLCSTYPVNLLGLSPTFRGSNPYPCGSLTYRVYCFSLIILALLL